MPTLLLKYLIAKLHWNFTIRNNYKNFKLDYIKSYEKRMLKKILS